MHPFILCCPIELVEFHFLMQFDISPATPNPKRKDRNRDVVNYVPFSDQKFSGCVPFSPLLMSVFYSINPNCHPLCLLTAALNFGPANAAAMILTASPGR